MWYTIYKKREGGAKNKMTEIKIPKTVLERLPVYLHYLRSLPKEERTNVSSAKIARALGLGEVQVRKDLALVCGKGRPKIGYSYEELKKHLEFRLGCSNNTVAVIVGAGRLGRALLSYEHFSEYGLDIPAAFDLKATKKEELSNGKAVFPMEELESFAKENDVKIGIICVPEKAAQQVADEFVKCGVKAIWNFAPGRISVAEGVRIKNENMAASLAVLSAGL